MHFLFFLKNGKWNLIWEENWRIPLEMQRQAIWWTVEMNASQKCGDDSRGDRNTEDAKTVAAASAGRDWRNKQAYHWLSLMRSRTCAIDTAPSHRESSIHLTFCHGCVDEILGQSAASVRVVGGGKKKKRSQSWNFSTLSATANVTRDW